MAENKRSIAYKNSSLPYSFNYKIRAKFVNKNCPICGCLMNYANNLVRPSIQHNMPINLGGLHELGNISVICFSCNTSIQNNITGELNANEVTTIWEQILKESENNGNKKNSRCSVLDRW